MLTEINIIIILYFAIGGILACHWWTSEYEKEYRDQKLAEGVEEAMATLMMLTFMFFWPIKLIFNAMRSLINLKDF